MAGRPGPPTDALSVAAVVLGVAVAVGTLAVRDGAGTTPQTSPLVLAACLGCGTVVLGTRAALGTAWVTWSRTLGCLALLVIAYPGAWALATAASGVAPGSAAAWAAAVLATTAHLPLVASFSVLPLLAVRYLGRGSTRVPLAVVAATGAAAATGFVLFFGDFAPLSARALVDWPAGESVGAAVNLAFLATVLLGTWLPARAAAGEDGEAARRLALVAATALAGTALVLTCGAVGSLSGMGVVVVLVAMAAAVGVLAVGCTRALTVALPVAAPPAAGEPGAVEDAAASPRAGSLTPREEEVLGLLAEGLSNAGIAARLVVSERTVDAHLRSVFAKLALPEGSDHNRRVHAALAHHRGRSRTEGV